MHHKGRGEGDQGAAQADTLPEDARRAAVEQRGVQSGFEADPWRDTEDPADERIREQT